MTRRRMHAVRAHHFSHLLSPLRPFPSLLVRRRSTSSRPNHAKARCAHCMIQYCAISAASCKHSEVFTHPWRRGSIFLGCQIMIHRSSATSPQPAIGCCWLGKKRKNVLVTNESPCHGMPTWSAFLFPSDDCGVWTGGDIQCIIEAQVSVKAIPRAACPEP